MSEQPRPRQRKIGSRSCDACKIRKVRCSEAPPCERCVAIGIQCTFNKTQSMRGPRTLRAKTLQQIQDAQQRRPDGSPFNYSPVASYDRSPGHVPPPPVSATPGAVSGGTPETSTSNAESDINARSQQATGGVHGVTVESLVLRLCIYRLRLFPVWPIIAVEEIIAALQRDGHDHETYALALAIGAATMAQLKLDRFKDSGINDVVTAQVLEAECQRIRDRLDGATANLNKLRTSFFLHIYHENQEPGGTKSLLFLREAITMAQIIGLHRPATYLLLDTAEDRIRRRILWLLFVTERGVAMLHKLPVVLRSAEKLPPLDGNGSEEEAHILPAFKKLVNLFWSFDQSGAFDVIQDAADDIDGIGGSASLNPELLNALQRRLQEDPLDSDQGSNDVQKADIAATRQWMKILVWRATLGSWRSTISNVNATEFGPVQIGHEFLELISRLPSAALEAHGPALEYKVYEIASAVADSIASHLNSPNTALQMEVRPSDILMKLQRILATSRGGNNSLLRLLATRIAQVEAPQFSVSDMTFTPLMPSRRVEEVFDDENRRWTMSEDNQQPDQQSSSRTSAPSSPWQSLVAAAEMEQQSISHRAPSDARGGFQSISRGQSRPGSPGMSWQTQQLGIINQLYNMDVPLSQSPSMDNLPAGELAEMLTGDNWFGLNMRTPSPRMG